MPNPRSYQDINHDHGWAWVISLSCASINGITFGLFRSYGVLFYELIKSYELTRQEAAWPFSLCATFTHLSGPVSVVLVSHFTLRTIVFFGSLIAAIGISLCFVATSYVHIVIFIGIIQGFGIGLSFMQTPVILSQYFKKYRSTATAIAYAGGTIGSFLFPPILDIILNEYGLSGTFLIIGGLMLNALPFALLLRPAIIDRKKTMPKIIKDVLQRTVVLSDQKPSNPLMNVRHVSIVNGIVFPGQSIKYIDDHNSHTTIVTAMDMILANSQNEYNLEQLYRERKYTNEEQCVCDTLANEEDISADNYQLVKDYYANKDKELVKDNDTEAHEPLTRDKLHDTGQQTHVLSEVAQRIKQIYSVINIPQYIILCITHVSFQWAWMTYQMVIIDFAHDRHMSERESVVLLTSFAVADLFGRLASGLISDKRLVSKKNIVTICILLIGVLIFITPSAQNFKILLTLTISLGFVCGSIIVLFSVLTMEYVGFDRLPLALGLTAFTVGISTLARPLAIGYFRDSVGNYDGLFQFIGITAFLTAMLWLAEPFVHLYIERGKRRTRDYGGFRVLVV